ncbi:MULTISPECIES: hypothetical protein [Cytobacillus]|uniref:Uncharacterized protein n=2 Tax=Cytobacillus firmus TaxID=1399 RepID=A0AA46P616_CYTFI|nr:MULTISPECIES: hypothetical protein [Cytobacillus]KML36137.1 hypothetical protein VL14_21945 [Cytobacillus firmus]MCS0652919.1 hypothetical protein [Cytobacillus firmus]MCU1803791.1 hypothetical protein [Cytobacillus firmus]UYG95824.1 hypothetical protein OD459_02010 [Cytobacillus firmus]
MSKTYTDYVNKTALTIEESYIDVKTGNQIQITPRVQEQLEYHTENQTLNHLILSALHQYFHPKSVSGNNEQILSEIADIKKLLLERNVAVNTAAKRKFHTSQDEDLDLDLNEVVDVLEAFGG